jgi:anthranilate phosphoribosyltransferase
MALTLNDINPILAKVTEGNNLSVKEATKLFHTVFTRDTEGYHLAVLIGAIHAKGETSDELLGFYNAVNKLAERLNTKLDPDRVIDLSGTGGGTFKTINVSTAASFVVAAAGYTVAKEAYYAVTGTTGSADVFAAFGIDISKLTKRQIGQALTKIGICPIFVPHFSPKLTNRAKISAKIFRERQIRVRSPFHLVSNVYSPLKMNYRIYGCYSKRYLEVLAELFTKLRFKRSLVMSAEIGIPEFSNVGKTYVLEQKGTHINRYTVSPKDLGVKEATLNDIKTGGKKQNIRDFLNILKGRGGPKSDLVAINAGAAFYTLGATKTLREGTQMAKDILTSGEAYTKLKRLEAFVNESSVNHR